MRQMQREAANGSLIERRWDSTVSPLSVTTAVKAVTASFREANPLHVPSSWALPDSMDLRGFAMGCATCCVVKVSLLLTYGSVLRQRTLNGSKERQSADAPKKTLECQTTSREWQRTIRNNADYVADLAQLLTDVYDDLYVKARTRGRGPGPLITGSQCGIAAGSREGVRGWLSFTACQACNISENRTHFYVRRHTGLLIVHGKM